MTYLALATIFSGLSFFVIKLVTQRIHPLLGNLIATSCAVGIQLIVFAYFKWRGTEMPFTSEGVYISLGAGVLAALYTMTLFYAFTQVDITKATPILYIGSLVLATLLGVLFLKETMSVYNMVGFALALGGIFLLLWK
jgi:uncharacterized membrane protein